MRKTLLTLLCLFTGMSSAFADHWTAPSVNDYEDRAPLFVQFYLGETVATGNDYVEIAAFVDDEVRGTAFVGNSQATAQTLLEVRGNIQEDTGKTITFKVFYDGLEYDLKKTETWNYEASAHTTPFVLRVDPLTGVTLSSKIEIEGVLPFTYDLTNDISYMVGGKAQKTTETTNSKLNSALTLTWDYANSESWFSVDSKNVLTAKQECTRGYLGLNVTGPNYNADAGPKTFNAGTSVYITAATIPPTSITVSPTSIEGAIGDNINNLIDDLRRTQQLSVTVLPDNATDKSYDYQWVEAAGINEKGTITAAGTYTVKFYCRDYPDVSANLTITVKEPVSLKCPAIVQLFNNETTTITLTDLKGDDFDPSKISFEFDYTDNVGPVATAVAADKTGLKWNLTGRAYGVFNYFVLYDGEYINEYSADGTENTVGGQLYINAVLVSEPGWDWISVNALPEGANSLPLKNRETYIIAVQDSVVEMRSQTQLLYNDPKLGVFGDITELTPEAGMYKVKSDTGFRLHLGTDVQSESTYQEILPNGVTLNKGYNWIAYTSSFAHNVNCEWAENANNGDMIIGKDNFATYSAGTWQTSESDPLILTPGKGYIYYATGTGTKVNFNYLPMEETDNGNGVNKRNLSELTGWTSDHSRFADNMPVIATLKNIDNPEDYIVGAFVNGECRGYGTAAKNGLMFINVSGKTGERIEFRLFSKTDNSIIDLNEQLSYSFSAGTLKAPVTLTSSGATAISTVEAAADSNATEVYDLSGRKLTQTQKGINILRSKDGKTVKGLK